MKKLLLAIVSLIGIYILWFVWSEFRYEAKRQRAYTLRKGMSRADVVSRMGNPDWIGYGTTSCSKSKADSCTGFSYDLSSEARLAIKMQCDSAYSAYTYVGKAEVTVFE